MKYRVLKTLAVATTISALAMSAMGCGSNDAANADTSSKAGASDDKTESDYTSVEGTVKMAGSTSMEKLCSALQESIQETCPGITIEAEFTGSSAGIESLAAGTVDIGNSSRALKDEEKSGGAVENIVAIDGIAVVTDTANKVTTISSDDLAKVYTGEITNWKDLGGEDEAIVVVGREAGSGTRGAFEELLKIEDKCKYANELDSTGAALAKVASTPGAIGYVSLDVVDDTVNALSINDVEPTEENIIAGNYMLSRPFVMATKGEVSEQSEAVQAFFEYLKSDAGQKVIKSVGLILPQ